MKTRLKTQFLALLIVLSLGGLTSLEPVLHNHDLDIHEEHEDCFSCGWTKISIEFYSDPADGVFKALTD